MSHALALADSLERSTTWTCTADDVLATLLILHDLATDDVIDLDTQGTVVDAQHRFSRRQEFGVRGY